jgi:hypothetical protein
MSNQFILIERDSPLVVSVQDLLAGDHLARFIVAMVEDLKAGVLSKNFWLQSFLQSSWQSQGNT